MPRVGYNLATADLNDEFVERLKKPIRRVWDMIGYDVLRDAETIGERIDNESAVECCIDGERLACEARDSHANAALDLMLTEYGYPKVLHFLSKKIRLV